MPPFHQITKEFLKAVLQGHKKLLKISVVKFINAPSFSEIGVKNIYYDVIKQPKMRDYFPDKLPKQCQMDRHFFFNIWATLYPQDVEYVIKHANA